MKVLVTGSNGLLGQKLCELLQQDAGIHLIATARTPLTLPLDRGVYRLMDITDAASVGSVIAETKPDVVLHAAAMTQVDQCEQQKDACWTTNVSAVEYIIDACRTHHAHLIYISTDFVFDGSHGPLDENEKPAPVNYYGQSKLAAEELVMNSGLSWAIIRTVLVYGITADMSRSNIVVWVKNNLEQGKPIQVVNDQWRTPTLAEDLAMGCYLAAKEKAKGIFHISGKDFLTPYDIALKAADFFQLDKSLITPTNASQFKQPGERPLITGFIIDKARKELGYEPHTLDEGIAIIAEQVSKHHQIRVK
jgi:dTDP-4-dehydrorhamnose reductase